MQHYFTRVFPQDASRWVGKLTDALGAAMAPSGPVKPVQPARSAQPEEPTSPTLPGPRFGPIPERLVFADLARLRGVLNEHVVQRDCGRSHQLDIRHLHAIASALELLQCHVKGRGLALRRMHCDDIHAAVAATVPAPVAPTPSSAASAPSAPAAAPAATARVVPGVALPLAKRVAVPTAAAGRTGPKVGEKRRMDISTFFIVTSAPAQAPAPAPATAARADPVTVAKRVKTVRFVDVAQRAVLTAAVMADSK